MGHPRGRASYHLSSERPGPAWRGRDMTWLSSKGLDGPKGQSLTRRTSAPRGIEWNTHRLMSHHVTQLHKGSSSMFPESWNNNERDLAKIVLNWAQFEHHKALTSLHLQHNTLPRGILNNADKFSASFRPGGLLTPVEEALHVSGLHSARLNCILMQDHYNSQILASRLSAQKLFYHLDQKSRQKIILFLDPLLDKKIHISAKQALWSVLKGPLNSHCYSVPTLSLGIQPKTEKFPVPYRVSLLSDTSVIPTDAGTLQGPSRPMLSMAGTDDLRSAGPSTRCLTRLSQTGNITAEDGLRHNPAHTQGMAPLCSEPDIQGQPEANSHDKQVEGADASSGSESASPSIHTFKIQKLLKTSCQPEFGQVGCNQPTAPRHHCAQSYYPSNIELSTDPKFITKTVTELGLLPPAQNSRPKWYQNNSRILRKYLDTGRFGVGQLPDLINQFKSLGSVKEFFKHLNTFWIEPRDPIDRNFIYSRDKLHNRIRKVGGIKDPGSNFFNATIIYKGVQYRTREHCIVYQKLLTSKIPLHRIEKYIKNPKLITTEPLDPCNPAHIKRLGTLIMHHERKSNDSWRKVCIQVVAEILIEHAFTCEPFFNYILDEQTDFFLHDLEQSKDTFWAGAGNYHGKLLNLTREILVSTASHAIQSGSTGYFGPLAKFLPQQIMDHIKMHPNTGKFCYNITSNSAETINKITTQPDHKTLRNRFLNRNTFQGTPQVHKITPERQPLPPAINQGAPYRPPKQVNTGREQDTQQLLETLYRRVTHHYPEAASDPELLDLINNPQNQIIMDEWPLGKPGTTPQLQTSPNTLPPTSPNIFNTLEIEPTSMETTPPPSPSKRPKTCNLYHSKKSKPSNPEEEEVNRLVEYINNPSLAPSETPPYPQSTSDQETATSTTPETNTTQEQTGTTIPPTKYDTPAGQTNTNTSPTPDPATETTTSQEQTPTPTQANTTNPKETTGEGCTTAPLQSPPPSKRKTPETSPDRTETTEASPPTKNRRTAITDHNNLENDHKKATPVTLPPNNAARTTTTLETTGNMAQDTVEQVQTTNSTPELQPNTTSRPSPPGTQKNPTGDTDKKPLSTRATLTQPLPTPNSINIHHSRSAAGHKKIPAHTTHSLIWSDETLKFLQSFRNPGVEIHIMENLNPNTLNLLLCRLTNTAIEVPNITDIYINMGYQDARNPRPTPDPTQASSSTTLMKANITLLRKFVPNATIHIFKLNADNKWYPMEIQNRYNRELTSMTDGIRVRTIKNSTDWTFKMTSDNTLSPENPQRAKEFLLRTLKVFESYSVKKKTSTTKSKNI